VAIARILGELRQLGGFFLSVTGGETCLRRDLVDVLHAARTLGFAVTLLTNGSLIDRALAERLVGEGVIEFEVTILGATAAVHDSITQTPGSHAAAWAGIHALHAAHANLLLKTPVLRQNQHDLEAIHAQATCLGLAHMASPILLPRWPGDTTQGGQSLDDAGTLDALRCQGRWVEAECPTGVELDDDAAEDRAYACRAGVTGLTIDPVGRVYACQNLGVIAGDCRTQPLAVIWRDSPLFAALRHNPPRGRALGFRCPALSHDETGDLSGVCPTTLRLERLLTAFGAECKARSGCGGERVP
jgi:MoaA/NifB/PqqE/SkfB family radical SAM enzyme